jgi:hypothetical protein
MTWILAIIIISAYIVFFAWIISVAPTTTDNTIDKITKITIDYSGMNTLTSTFGIIVAAIIGYYFGQRNLEKATTLAQNATDIAKVATNEAEVKKIGLNNEKNDYVNEVETGIPLYRDISKTISSLIPEKALNDDQKKNLTQLKSELEERIVHLQKKSKTKKKELEASELTVPVTKIDFDVVPD